MPAETHGAASALIPRPPTPAPHGWGAGYGGSWIGETRGDEYLKQKKELDSRPQHRSHRGPHRNFWLRNPRGVGNWEVCD
jgi:hypothetical protein